MGNPAVKKPAFVSLPKGDADPDAKAALAERRIIDGIKRAQAGDPTGFADLVDETQAALFRFCLYLTANRQLANDLTQDTLVRVLEKIETVTDAKGFKSWLFRVAKNLFIDHQRSRKPGRETEYQEATRTDLTDVPVQGSREVALAVQEVFAKMDPDDRMVLILVDMEGYAYDEAADLIGISESALRSRLHRARKDFIRRYEKN